MTVLFTVTVALLLSALVNAQSSCFFYPRDGSEIDVGEGPFQNPEFCNKECECVRSFPNFESGIPLDTTICGCYHQDETTSELYCLVVGEVGLIPELGRCECTQRELPTLTCEPAKPTSSPVAPPAEPSISMTPSPAGKVSESSKSPVPAGGGDISEPSPVIPASEAAFRNSWWLLIISCYILPFAALS